MAGPLKLPVAGQAWGAQSTRSPEYNAVLVVAITERSQVKGPTDLYWNLVAAWFTNGLEVNLRRFI